MKDPITRFGLLTKKHWQHDTLRVFQQNQYQRNAGKLKFLPLHRLEHLIWWVLYFATIRDPQIFGSILSCIVKFRFLDLIYKMELVFKGWKWLSMCRISITQKCSTNFILAPAYEREKLQLTFWQQSQWIMWSLFKSKRHKFSRTVL